MVTILRAETDASYEIRCDVARKRELAQGQEGLVLCSIVENSRYKCALRDLLSINKSV